jgi:signal transduction protein with GAF and PtsI domain
MKEQPLAFDKASGLSTAPALSAGDSLTSDTDSKGLAEEYLEKIQDELESEIDEELQRQMDEQLEKEMDQVFEEYQREMDRVLEKRLAEEIRHLSEGMPITTTHPSLSASAGIQSTIDKVVDQYKRTQISGAS